MLITLWWKAGSGKWTVWKLLSEKLGYEIISIGDMKRKLATEMWINIIEFNKMWDDPKKSAEFDLKYEEYQKSLKLSDKIILDSRLWFYAQPKAFKILLDVDENEAWKRIFNAKRETDKNATIKDAITEVKERNLWDEERYKRLYNVDLWNPNNYNLVIDTTERSPENVLEIILEEFKNYKFNKWIADTPDEQKELKKTKKKQKILKIFTYSIALIIILWIRIFTIVTTYIKNKDKSNSQENILEDELTESQN